MSLLHNAKLISNATGQEIPLYSRVPDKDGHNCLVEALIDHPEGDMVLICHEAAGVHLVFPHVLNARIERADPDTNRAVTMTELNDIELKFARIRARDEANELVEERATALAAQEGSTVFDPRYGDNPDEVKIRNEYRARVRKELGL